MTPDRSVRDTDIAAYAVGAAIDGYVVMDERSGHPVTPSMRYMAAVRERDTLNSGGCFAILAAADRVLGRAGA